jgi:hypothetical protein
VSAPTLDLDAIPLAAHEAAMRLAIAVAEANPFYPFGAVIIGAADRTVLARGVNSPTRGPASGIRQLSQRCRTFRASRSSKLKRKRRCSCAGAQPASRRCRPSAHLGRPMEGEGMTACPLYRDVWPAALERQLRGTRTKPLSR